MNTRDPRAFRLSHKLLLSAAACAVQPAAAETQLSPYVETRLVARSSDPFDLGSYRIFSEATAGVSANFDSKRVDGSLYYRISRRLPLGNTPVSDRVRQYGSGSVRSELVRDYLYLNASGNASVVSPSLGGFINPDSDNRFDQQAYGAAVQPIFSHTFANRIRTTATYRYGLFETEGGSPPLMIGQVFNIDRPYFGGSSDTRNQSASASIGNVSRSDRLRLQLNGNWQRDRIEQLNEHYDSKRLVLDGEFAITRFLSVVGSGGYEDIHNELDQVFLDPLTGFPILDSAGRLQRDPFNPRYITFDYAGETYDAGVRLKPSRRTGLLARAGKRYGSFSASGSAYYQIRSDLTLSASYNDSIDNFGRLFTTFFADPITGTIIPVGSFAGGGGRNTPIGAGSCALGYDFETGACELNLTQIATSATFRNKTASLRLQRGSAGFEDPNSRFYGHVTAFYTHRRYLGEPQERQVNVVSFVPALYLAGTTDQSYGLYVRGERLLGGNRYATVNLRAQRNEYALSRGAKDFYLSASGRYEMLLDRNINIFATAFAARRIVDRDPTLSPLVNRFITRQRNEASFSVGVRYLFAPFKGRFTPFTNRRGG